MKTPILFLALLAGPAFCAEAVHPVAQLIRSQPAALESVSGIAEVGLLKPELFLKGLAALSQAAPKQAAHRNAASGASVAVLALAARPELAAQAGLSADAARGLSNISQAFHKLAAEQPTSWGQALARAKALDIDAAQPLERLGPKLLQIFDGSAPAPDAGAAQSFPKHDGARAVDLPTPLKAPFTRGRLVRFEGPEALVTVEEADHEVLKLLDAKTLRAAGLRENGQTFIIDNDGARVSAALRWRITSLGVLPAVSARDIALIKADPRARILSQDGKTLVVEATLRELHAYSDLFKIERAGPEDARQLTLQTPKGPMPMPVFRYPSLASLILEGGPGLKIEVGPGDRPLPGDFIKVDKNARDGLGRPNSVLDDGVIADAKALPLADSSAAVIASKHFGWFGGGKQALIEAVLREYKRALNSGGLALLLVDSRHERPDIWREHAAVAFLLGFEVSFVRIQGEKVEGLLLRKR